MNAKRVNAAAGVIVRSMENGRKTPAGWAMDLESAQLLMSPEVAAELEQLRRGVDGLRRELGEHLEFERRLQERIDALLAERHSTNEALDDAVQELRARDAGRSAVRLTRLLAPTQVLREVPDGEHYAATHHEYRVGHDLPETGGEL